MNTNLDRRGVSPIIATLLLIVIAVAAAVVTYTFVMGFVGTGTQTSSTAQSQLSYDSYSVNGTSSSSIKVYLRNIGGKTAVVNAVYVDGNLFTYEDAANETHVFSNLTSPQWTLFVTDPDNPTTSIDVNQVGRLYIQSTTPAGNTQRIRIVCADGTPF
ncbi:MAG: archaellin/type IV pilin N-terminal domain-containing protein, partial [Candidatus Methanomethyliaceae archaeon]